MASIRHLGHRGVLATLTGGLALLTVVLVILGITLPPAPTTPCTSLQCLVPFGTPAQAPALSLWADPDLNGVRWKGESLP